MRPAATSAAVVRARVSRGVWRARVKVKRCLKVDFAGVVGVAVGVVGEEGCSSWMMLWWSPSEGVVGILG